MPEAAALDAGPAGRTQKWPASTGTGTLARELIPARVTVPARIRP